MNNIDILEEKIKIIESLCTDDCINKETVIKPLKYAISTLIAENKELKAIEYIENCLDDEYDYKNATRQKDKKAHNIILNLIEKQSKEIEELKNKLKIYTYFLFYVIMK